MFSKKILLNKYSSFKIGGPAEYFFEAQKIEDIIEAVKKAKQMKIPVFIFGGGTKLLISDKGFNGLAIKIHDTGHEILAEKITAGAGTGLNQLVADSIKAGLTGLEWAIGIPGTIGGAVCGNCGAFGSSISKNVKSAIALNPETLEIKKYSKEECQFDYRSSVFKRNGSIIVSVEIKLEKGDSVKSMETIKEYLKKRRERIPAYPSCGSIFKNLKFKDLNEKTQKLISAEKIKGGMVPAGYLIEECGLKGKQIGGAKISDQQANIFINFNQATAKDVLDLIDLAKREVSKKFGVNLEEEVVYLS